MEGVIAIVALFMVMPAILFSFLYKVKKNKHEVEKLKYQKEILELEMKKDEIKMILLEEENRKLDKIINAE